MTNWKKKPSPVSNFLTGTIHEPNPNAASAQQMKPAHSGTVLTPAPIEMAGHESNCKMK